MAYDQHSGCCADSKEEKAIFVFGVVGIMQKQCIVVAEYGTAFFE
jgi:hypothetical protein